MSDMNWNPFDPDLLKKTAEQAEASAQASAFGKLTMASRYLKFGGAGEKPTEITPQEYAKALAGKERGVMQEVQFSVDPSEFSPSAAFLYERKVRVTGREQVKETKKYVKSDWIVTVLPSLNEAFGSIDEFSRRLSSKEPVYVEVVDTPQQADPKYNTIKFIRVFANLAECKTAWAAKYGGSANGNGHALPADVVNTVLLLKRAIKDTAQLQATIKADPTLNQYAFEDLMKVG